VDFHDETPKITPGTIGKPVASEMQNCVGQAVPQHRIDQPV
jgi:hypothetical protein